MTLRFYIVALLVSLLPAACSPTLRTAADTPERSVEVAFLVYKSALQQRSGAVASGLMTRASHGYYRQIADEALTADRQRLLELPVSDRMTVLMFRHGLTVEKLRHASGKALAATAVDRGWFGQTGAAAVELTNFRITGDEATANLLGKSGEVSEVTMKFLREDDAWRIDLLHSLEQGRKAMKLGLALSGMSEDELVHIALEKATGRKPGPEIWNPPL
jgi:hypothetical protein